MISVTNLIVHEVKKNEGDVFKTQLVFSENLLPIEEEAVGLVEELEKKYAVSSQTNAVFDFGDGSNQDILPELYSQFLDKDLPLDFKNFSIQSTKGLIKHIDNVPPAKGGYLIFVEYQNRHKFLAVFLVRHKKGNTFQFDKTQKFFKIGESIYIDLEHLAMAARINVSLYKQPDIRYLSFINKAQIDSKYFLKWFCANETHNNKEDTKSLRKILNSIDTPLDENNAAIDRVDFIDRVVKNIKNLKRGEHINLKQIGLAFYDDEAKLLKYAQENDIIINHEFKADRIELRKFVNLYIEADKISLNFPLSYLDTGIVRMEQGNVIINSSKLVERINTERKANDK